MFAASLLAVLVPLPDLLRPDLSSAGAGTEIVIDDGYPQAGRKWVSIIKPVVVIGTYRDCFVCIERGDSPPYDGFILVSRFTPDPRVIRIIQMGYGDLHHVEPNVSIREAP